MKKKKKIKKIYLFFAVFLIFFIAISIYVNKVVYSVINEYAEARVKSMTTIAVNNAILTVLNQEIAYSDLVKINTDESGNVQYIEANTIKINNIAKNTAYQSKNELNKIGEQILKIPLGTLTNSPILNGYGPPINIKLLSSGSVICHFKSQFTGAGINQTRHRIFIEVCADMDLVLPSSQNNIQCTIEVFIAEAVIVGQVPEAYLNFDVFNKLNLIPEN